MHGKAAKDVSRLLDKPGLRHVVELAERVLGDESSSGTPEQRSGDLGSVCAHRSPDGAHDHKADDHISDNRTSDGRSGDSRAHSCSHEAHSQDVRAAERRHAQRRA